MLFAAYLLIMMHIEVRAETDWFRVRYMCVDEHLVFFMYIIKLNILISLWCSTKQFIYILITLICIRPKYTFH